ncbi:MAG: hypothetical protein R2741_09510 [Methanolobus sp.]
MQLLYEHGTDGEGLEMLKISYLPHNEKKCNVHQLCSKRGLEMASQTNDYSDLIEYNHINYYSAPKQMME